MTAIYSLYLLTSFFPKGFLTQWSVCTALSSPESWEPLFMRQSLTTVICILLSLVTQFQSLFKARVLRYLQLPTLLLANGPAIQRHLPGPLCKGPSLHLVSTVTWMSVISLVPE